MLHILQTVHHQWNNAATTPAAKDTDDSRRDPSDHPSLRGSCGGDLENDSERLSFSVFNFEKKLLSAALALT